jgi:hypothetical protein
VNVTERGELDGIVKFILPVLELVKFLQVKTAFPMLVICMAVDNSDTWNISGNCRVPETFSGCQTASG